MICFSLNEAGGKCIRTTDSYDAYSSSNSLKKIKKKKKFLTIFGSHARHIYKFTTRQDSKLMVVVSKLKK